MDALRISTRRAAVSKDGGAPTAHDFDQVMQSPMDPASMNPNYDSGDHLHPNDQAYQTMANAIDVGLLN